MTPADRDAVAAALDRRLDPASPEPIVVALSGGSDSLGLLLCARDWARAAGRSLLALTVDHRLHPDSGRWTAEAGATARRLGADWRALAWDGPKPAAGLPAAARRARHALLAQATRAAGGCVLLMGHTADDVAESELIRRETPTHGRLAEWAPSPVWPEGRGVFVLRPLLTVRRAALRARLEAEGVGWLEDPANSDLRYARGRARDALPSPSRGKGSGMGVENAEVEGLEVAQATTPDATASPTPIAALPPSRGKDSMHEVFGGLRLSRAPLPADTLAKAILCVSGRERPPWGVAIARLQARLAVGESFTATLAGARLIAGAQAVDIVRELGRAPPPPVALDPGAPAVFDGRFEVTAAEPGWRVAALAGRAAALGKAEREALRAVPAAARLSLPVLLDAHDAPRLPAPFGAGPASARCLAAERFVAARGAIGDERTLSAQSRAHPRGVSTPLILSSTARE